MFGGDPSLGVLSHVIVFDLMRAVDCSDVGSFNLLIELRGSPLSPLIIQSA